MTIRYRPMCPRDVRACVDIIESIPSARRMYGDAIGDLHEAWLRVLGCEAKSAVVFEEVAGSSSTMCSFGISVFVQDDFIKELKARPFWFAPELARRLRRGCSPLLSDSELRKANSRGGVNVLVWEGRLLPAFESNPDVFRKLASGFLEEHRGYFWKEVICHQIETVERLLVSMQVGGLVWDPVSGRYKERLEQTPEEFLSKPHVLGITRETERNRPGSWMGNLFEYQPPVFGFNRSEQRLLLCALQGGTDQELSDELAISLDTVKKTWRLIYERVAARSPELIPVNSAAENGGSERGREKKQRLIAYLREHPEELRPVSRKLLLRHPDVAYHQG